MGQEPTVNYTVNDQVVLSHAPAGPLATYVVAFADALSQRGYAHYSTHRQVMLAACFCRWLQRTGVARRHVTSEHTARYLRCRYRHWRPRRGDRPALDHFIGFLRHQGAIPAARTPRRRLAPVQRCVQRYQRYLREDRALAEATIVNYVPFIARFLTGRFGSGPVRLSQLTAHDVVRFVERRAPRLHRKRAKLLTTALRSFLRYTRYHGETQLDLAAAVPCVANWSMASIPRGIAPEQVEQLLRSIDRSTAVGRRDYAVLLLLARLGLRAGEVASLELQDLDWERGCLHAHGKGGRSLQLPLPKEVGDAIVAYLQNGRAQSVSRRLFLRTRAPVCGFLCSSAVSCIVRHALLRAGIAAPTHGAHQFRHGLATQLLRQGASLVEIGQVLGHRSPETTRIYTKVDLEALRTLALPWPGGAP
ncbi:MAG: site-specific integrase [Rhodanobacteraceae bacterium]